MNCTAKCKQLSQPNLAQQVKNVCCYNGPTFPLFNYFFAILNKIIFNCFNLIFIFKILIRKVFALCLVCLNNCIANACYFAIKVKR